VGYSKIEDALQDQERGDYRRRLETLAELTDPTLDVRRPDGADLAISESRADVKPVSGLVPEDRRRVHYAGCEPSLAKVAEQRLTCIWCVVFAACLVCLHGTPVPVSISLDLED